jgi:type I restriction enzyme M protein
VFKPYAGVSTAIFLFTKTGVGGTENVWFYDIQADGYSLDDKRTALLPDEKLGTSPQDTLTDDDHTKNNLPDVITRWALKDSTETHNPRTAQSFCVPKADIVAAGYDLSLNRYKETKHETQTFDPPQKIIGELREMEVEIVNGLAQLELMLSSPELGGRL